MNTLRSIRFGELAGGESSVTHFIMPFTFADVLNGRELLIDNVPQGKIILKTVIEILEEFDDDTTCTIGDDIAEGRLMTSSENSLGEIGKTETNPDYQYTENTNIKLFFSDTNPTLGAGIAKIYIL